MEITRRDSHHGLAGKHSALGHPHRDIAADGAVVAKLTIDIVSPSRYRSVRAQGEAMVTTRRDSHHGLAGKHPTLIHQHGDTAAEDAAAVAELAIKIEPPGRDGSVRAQGEAMVTTRRDSHDALAGKHPALIHQHGDAASGGAVVAEFSVVIVSPSRYRSVRAQGEAMEITRRDSHHGLAGKHSALIHQRGVFCVACGACGAELSRIIVCPSR